MSSLPGLVLALLSLVAWTAAAQSQPERTLRARRVSLTGAAVDVRVAPDIPTTLNFDADLDPLSVTVDESHVQLLSVAVRAITLLPVANLKEAVTLRVRFADASLTMEAHFSLRTDAAELDTQVMAYRDALSPALLLARVAELEARTAACEAEAVALRERGRVTDPTALVLSGQLGTEGIQVADLPDLHDISAGGLQWVKVRRFRAETWLVVSATVRNPPGQPVWKPGGAWLVGESSRERMAARVVALEPEALASEAEVTLAMEFPRPPDRPGEVYRVEAQEAEGSRHLSFHVTVDEPQQAARKKDGP